MDSNTKIGNVTQFILATTNGLGETTETALNKNLVANTDATYSEVDTAMKALASMSTETYDNSYLITRIGVNEVIAG